MRSLWNTREGSSARLLQLCVGYFVFYVITGVSVKYFQGPASAGFPGLLDMEFLVYSTAGGTGICLFVVLALRWYRLSSIRPVRVGPFSVPSELLYIIPSGVCTAIVIPTTTLLYSFEGVSVMVAMVIMRGAVIIIGRLVDALQIRQKILRKRVYFEENVAVVFALAAVAVVLLWETGAGFDFLGSTPAVVVLSSYIVAYFIRIYIMNFYKNTRPPNAKSNDNTGFFAVEQIAASITMVALAAFFYASPSLFGWRAEPLLVFKGAFDAPKPMWGWALLAGVAYGIVAFFSVFIFMFKGRTATFAGLVNRLTSLVAGTTATLVSFLFFGGRLPEQKDWASLALILVAVGFLTVAEKKRGRELAGARSEAVDRPAETRLRAAQRG